MKKVTLRMSLNPRSKPANIASKRPRAARTDGAPRTERTALTRERIEIEALALIDAQGIRSEERRVGKECCR